MKIRIRHGKPFAEYEVEPGAWRQVETVEVVTPAGVRECGNINEFRSCLNMGLASRDREFARSVLRLVLDSESGAQEAQRLFAALTHDYDGDDVMAVAWAADDANEKDRAAS